MNHHVGPGNRILFFQEKHPALVTPERSFRPYLFSSWLLFSVCGGRAVERARLRLLVQLKVQLLWQPQLALRLLLREAGVSISRCAYLSASKAHNAGGFTGWSHTLSSKAIRGNECGSLIGWLPHVHTSSRQGTKLIPTGKLIWCGSCRNVRDCH